MTRPRPGRRRARRIAPAVAVGVLTVAWCQVTGSVAAVAPRAGSPQEGQGEEPQEILGAPSAFGPAGTVETRVAIPPGTPLRERPDALAGALAIVDAEVELAELERRGDWVRVRYGGLKGWVRLGDRPTAGGAAEPSLDQGAGASPSRTSASGEPGAGPDRRLVERAREILGEGALEQTLGDWTLLTDVRAPRLLRSLERLVRELAPAYRERYALAPSPPGEPEVVVLFDREESYREFVGPGTPAEVLDAPGQAGFGVAALARGDRDADAVRALLVHELVHLLNRRSLGPRTPPWLEEGLADALASSRIAPSGALAAEILGGSVRRIDEYRDPSGERRIEVELTGGLSGLELVTKTAARGALPSLEQLTSESWRTLSDAGVRTLRYAHSSLFVRYLLDGDRQRWRPGFQAYLRGVAAGEPAHAGRLLEHLGVEGWAVLEEGLADYLRLLRLTG